MACWQLYCNRIHVKIEASEVGKKPSQDCKTWQDSFTARSLGDAAAFGEIVGIATLWEETPRAITTSGEKNFAEKVVVVINITNPLDFSKGMPPTPAIIHTYSGIETV
jgi:predicted dinucleotide-binding enzyme